MADRKPIVWTVHPDGLHIHTEGRLVGVIDVSQGMYLIEQLAPSVVDYMRSLQEKQKTPQPD
mgnify:FL=1